MNDSLQLPVCLDCDMIQANRIWEIRPEVITKHYDEHINVLDLILSEFDINDYRIEILLNYETLKRDLILRGYNLETQMVAIIYYTLQTNDEPVYIRKYSKFVGAKLKLVFKLSKRIAKYYSNNGVFLLDNLEKYYSHAKCDRKIIENFIQEYEGTLTRSVMAWFFYVGSDLTQMKTSELFGITLQRLIRAKKVIENG